VLQVTPTTMAMNCKVCPLHSVNRTPQPLKTVCRLLDPSLAFRPEPRRQRVGDRCLQTQLLNGVWNEKEEQAQLKGPGRSRSHRSSQGTSFRATSLDPDELQLSCQDEESWQARSAGALQAGRAPARSASRVLGLSGCCHDRERTARLIVKASSARKERLWRCKDGIR